MMTNIFFFAVFVYGLVQLFFHEQMGFETNLVWYAQTWSAILVGGGVSMWNIKDTLAGLMAQFTKPSVKETEAKKNPDQCFTPEAYEERDFDSLVHLRNRCIAAGSQEGIDTCAKLAGILFQLKIKGVDNKDVQVTA